MRVYGSRLLFDSHHCLNNDGVQAVPLRRAQSAAVTNWVARRRVRALSRRPASRVGSSSTENRSARTRHTGRQHPGALGQPGPLVRPVIKRGRADHQVEGGCGPGQLLGGSYRKTQPAVGRLPLAASIMADAASIPARASACGARAASWPSR